MGGLREDTLGGKIQGFAPDRIVAITATVAWVPGPNDRAFRAGVATNYYMSGVSAREAALVAGAITVINQAVRSYTFDTTLELEVM